MKILCPIDFTPTSTAALRYASAFGHAIGATQLEVIHIIQGSLNVNESVLNDPYKIMEDTARERLNFFVEELSLGDDLECPLKVTKRTVRFGIPGFTVIEHVKDANPDFIVMGTRDKHGFFDKIIGSASTIVSSKATCPVILIHKDTVFKGIDKIGFSFDHRAFVQEVLPHIDKVNSAFQASLDFIHVQLSKDDLSTNIEDILHTYTDNNHNPYAVEVNILPQGILSEELQKHCDKSNIDLLMVYHRYDGFFQELFGESHAVKVAQDLSIPVMVLHDHY